MEASKPNLTAASQSQLATSNAQLNSVNQSNLKMASKVSLADLTSPQGSQANTNSTTTNPININVENTESQPLPILPHSLDELLPGPKELPIDPFPGSFPIFLTGMTQDLFKLKTGVDVTIEKPMKFIPKSDILSDLYARAAVSDWSPFKKDVNVKFFFEK
jgi:hypothetical protein